MDKTTSDETSAMDLEAFVPPPRQALRGLLAIALAAALWALGAAVARRLFDSGMTPLELTTARSVIAAAGLALLRRAPARARMSTSALLLFGLSIALVNYTYYFAIDHLAVAVAVVIQYTGPVFVVGWSALIARRAPSRAVMVACAVSVIGVVLISEVAAGHLASVDSIGLLAAASSAFLFASYTILSEKAGDAYGTVGGLFRAFAIASVLWVVVLTTQGAPEELFDIDNLLEVAAVGVLGTLVPFLLYIWGIQRVRAERAVIAATLEPVLAALLAWIWLEQGLSGVQVTGGVLVIAAVVSLQLEQARRRAVT